MLGSTKSERFGKRNLSAAARLWPISVKFWMSVAAWGDTLVHFRIAAIR